MTLPDRSPDSQARSDALVQAYLALRPTLVRAFSARLRSPDAAEELAQELYLRVRAQAGAAVDEPRAWLFRVAQNLMLDGVRAQARATGRETRWAAEGGPEEAPEPSADRVVAGRQVLERALTAVDAMPPRMREAFQLHRLQGLTQPQVARRMGVSLKVVEKHLAAGLERLTSELKGVWP